MFAGSHRFLGFEFEAVLDLAELMRNPHTITAQDWRRRELAEGLRLYRAHNYFAAHEQWEAVWLRSQEPEKTVLQAMIQVAAACHHYQRGNRRGVRSLLKAALRRLNANDDAAFESIRLGELRAALFLWLAALQAPCATEAELEPPAQVRFLWTLDN